jgi:hypothetical protein
MAGSSSDSLARDIAEVPPLTIDVDSQMEGQENIDDFEENFERPYRTNAARTLHHAQRGDNDTM